MESKEYKTFNPLIDNPIDRLDDTLNALDFLGGVLDATATVEINEMLISSEQRGLAHILKSLRREINDVTQFLDDQGVDRLVKCHPRREREDEGLEVLSMVAGLATRKAGGNAEGGEASQA